MRTWTAAFRLLVALAAAPSLGFAWGHEGHQIVALIAEHYMTPVAVYRAKAILDGAPLEDVASWADDYRRDHPETGPWHYIDIPLADSKIDMARECPDGDGMIDETEHFLAAGGPQADRASKAEALKPMVHFVGNMHQPLHGEESSHCLLNDPDCCLRVGHLDDPFVVAFVPQRNDDGVGGIVYIPEYPLAVLVERPRSDHSWKVGAGHPKAVPPAVRNAWVFPDARDVGKRDFQGALEGPEFVGTANVQCQLAVRHGQIDH